MGLVRMFFVLVGFLLLHVSCSKVTGEISINYTKAEAIYGNLDSLRSIPLKGQSQPVVKAVGHYIGKNYILIGERSVGIHVFDNSNMTNPENVAFLNIPFCKEFYVDGDYLYAESGYDLLKIRIKDFRNPIIENRMKNAFTNKVYQNEEGSTLLGFTYSTATDKFEVGSAEANEIKEKGALHVDYNGKMIPLSTVPAMFAGNNGESKGTINRIGVYYNHIYVVGRDKLHIFQTNNGSITKSSPITVDENSETVYIDRNRLYIGSEDMVRIYLLDNMSSPKLASKVEHSTSCDPVLADGEIAYSTLRSVSNEGCTGSENVLMVLDVEKSKRASMLRSIDMKSPYGMALVNNKLFVGEGINGLTVFDVEKREKPRRLERFENIVAYDVMIHPTNPNIIIVTHKTGLREFSIDWDNLTLNEVGSLQYK